VGDFGIETVTLPNGVTVELEILKHPGASAVVPVHPDGSITLIRQYRHAAGGMIYEVPAGKLDPGEDPATCAGRELTEETGLVAGTLRHLTTIHTTPGFTDEVIHLYVATELSEAEAHPEGDEVIERHTLPAAQVHEMIRSGEITDSKTICAVLLATGAAG
jgi:ADP-ribose pyrophosphatase